MIAMFRLLSDGAVVPCSPPESKIERVALTHFANGTLVSTMFLGVDARYIGVIPLLESTEHPLAPEPFELAIFIRGMCNERRTYPTLAAAKAGHSALCAKMRRQWRKYLR